MQHGNFASPSVGNQPIGRTNSVSYAPQDSPTITDAERDQARNWFVAIDQDGNEELSYEELRTHSFYDPLPCSAQLLYRPCALD
jgi:hypothetical protein